MVVVMEENKNNGRGMITWWKYFKNDKKKNVSLEVRLLTLKRIY